MHEHEGESFFTRYLELLSDPAHWAFEITLMLLIDGLLLALIARPLMKRWVKRHDREVHGHGHEAVGDELGPITYGPPGSRFAPDQDENLTPWPQDEERDG